MTCSGCGNALEDREGVELWGSRFCSSCFIGNAAKIHRELRPEDLAQLRSLGKYLAGFLPPELVEMLAVGFYRRSTGRADSPPAEELSRFVGEVQRLVVFSTGFRIMGLLKSLKGEVDAFVESQGDELRDIIRRLTDLE